MYIMQSDSCFMTPASVYIFHIPRLTFFYLVSLKSFSEVGMFACIYYVILAFFNRYGRLIAWVLHYIQSVHVFQLKARHGNAFIVL